MFKMFNQPEEIKVNNNLPKINIIDIDENDFVMTPKGAKCTKFTYLIFNRQYAERKKFDRLKDSLSLVGKNLVPIIAAEIDNEYYLIDGQGRLACIYGLIKGTGKSFPLRVYLDNDYKSKDELLSVVINVNNTATPWDVIDYLNARVAIEQDKNLSNEDGIYTTLKNLIEEDYADVSYKTAIDVLGEDKNKVLEDLKEEWVPRFELGKKVLNKCKDFPIEKLRTSNKIIKGVDYISRNALDIDIDTIFDKLRDPEDLLSIMTGTAEAVIGILLDVNDSNLMHKSRLMLSKDKAKALLTSGEQCEAMIVTRHGGKRCAKTSTLEFHHDLAHASNGSNGENNIRILCSKCNNTAKTNPVVFYNEPEAKNIVAEVIKEDIDIEFKKLQKIFLKKVKEISGQIFAEPKHVKWFFYPDGKPTPMRENKIFTWQALEIVINGKNAVSHYKENQEEYNIMIQSGIDTMKLLITKIDEKLNNK